jgi:dihydropyrimidinase
MLDWMIRGANVWLGGKFVKTNVFVKDGHVAHIGPERLEVKQIYDCEDNYLIPGLIDPHVHFDLDLGSRRSKDDFYTGSVCAALGGVTTVIDFLAPSSNAKELKKNYKARCEDAAECMIDYAFHATIKDPEDPEEFLAEMNLLGLDSLKFFTTYSESGRRTDHDQIKALLSIAKKHHVVLLGHLEKDELIDLNPNFLYQRLGESRSTEAETTAALELARMVKDSFADFYMVHCSSGKTLEALMKRHGDLLSTRFFVESCPHYLLFDESVLYKPDGYLYTMAPPLRPEAEKNALYRLFSELRTIGTDHCSFDRADKNKDYLKDIPLGVGGIEHSFHVLYHEFGDAVIDKMSKNPAAIFRLKNKGEIKVGFDADFALFKKGERVIEESHSAADSDIYLGRTVSTEFVMTMLEGRIVMEHGNVRHSIGRRIKGIDL